MLISFVPGLMIDRERADAASRARVSTVPQKSVSSRPRITSALATSCRALSL